MRRPFRDLSFKLFRAAARAGFFVLPNHYYVPISDVNQLHRSKPTWARKSDLPGLPVDLDQQAANLRRVCVPYQAEYAGNAVYRQATAGGFGPGYGYLEAQALHAVVRHLKPGRIIEVGSAVSTVCILRALAMNESEVSERASLTCIDPFASPSVRALDGVDLLTRPVQEIGMEVFGNLEANDLLFIDSSHVVRPGGDVNHLVLEILPRLPRGVVVQMHDIYLPYDYPRGVLTGYFQWMETSLVRAFMVNNPRIEILFCLSLLHYERGDVLREVFPEYDPAPDDRGLEEIAHDGRHFPSSLYIRIL